MDILVVDDSKMFRHILNNTLRELGYDHIYDASNVTDAKRILDKIEIDLILSDWNMPGESGLDLLKWARSSLHLSKIPFVIISTESEKANIFKAIQQGVQAYLIKPVKKELLYEKLEALAKSHNIMPPCILSPYDMGQGDTEQVVTGGKRFSDQGTNPIENAPHLGIRLDGNTCVISVEAAQQENLSELIPVLFPGARYIYITSENVEKKYNANIKIWKDTIDST
jgi:two-component system, chemotaxis family, chemotaxis protein CheY